MRPNKNRYKDTPNRWQFWDYSAPGRYFITICTQGNVHLFGKIENEKMVLNPAGECVANEILKIPTYHPRVVLDEFVIMPNHFHCIIELGNYNFNNGKCEPVGQFHEIVPNQSNETIPVGQFHKIVPNQSNETSIVGQFHEIVPDQTNETKTVGQIHEFVLQSNNEKFNNGQIREFVQQAASGEFTIVAKNKEESVKEYRKLRRRMLIPMIVGKFEMLTSKQINILNHSQGRKNWQTDYYDHVIRNQDAYWQIKNYIRNNPKN